MVVAEVGVWAPASCCQMPRNRRGPTPQPLLAESLVHVASLIHANNKSAAGAVIQVCAPFGYSQAPCKVRQANSTLSKFRQDRRQGLRGCKRLWFLGKLNANQV